MKFKQEEVKFVWVKCSESLSNRVSNIIRRYTDHMKFVPYMSFSFYHFLSYFLVPFFIIVLNGCMFCVLLFNFENHVFLLLCLYILIVMYYSVYCFIILFCVLFYV